MFIAGFLLSLSCKTLKDMTNLQNLSETWKPIVGYESLYEVSNLGNIKSVRFLKRRKVFRNLLLIQPLNKYGYPCVMLCNGKPKFSTVHRLVALTFIPNPDNKETVNHKNGIKTDNRVENLEWATPNENYKHSLETGLQKNFKDNHPRRKLSSYDVSHIRMLSFTGNYSQKKLARIFGVCHQNIASIVNYQTWIPA